MIIRELIWASERPGSNPTSDSNSLHIHSLEECFTVKDHNHLNNQIPALVLFNSSSKLDNFIGSAKIETF